MGALLSRFLPSHETPPPRDCRKSLLFIQNIAQRISEDRERIEDSVLKNHQNFQNYVFKNLELNQTSLQDNIYTSMQQKYSLQNEQEEEILKSLGTVERDFVTLKNQLHALLPHEKIHTIQQDSHSETIANILTEAQEDFRKLISENRSKKEEMFQSISRFLAQSQSDIRKEVTLFSSKADDNENFSDKNFKVSPNGTLDRVERMEKNLISVHAFLGQQRSKVETLQQIVERFIQKFEYFVAVFDEIWKQNKAASVNAGQCGQLEEAEVIYTSLAENIDINASLLMRQSKKFAHILADVKNKLTMNEENLGCLSVHFSKDLEGRSLEFPLTPDSVWTGSVDVLNQELENLLLINENTKEKVESLKRTSNSFENFHNLMKSITRGYNTLLRFFLSTLELSQKFCATQKTILKQNEDVVKTDIGTYDESKNRKIDEINEDVDVNAWHRERNELEDKFQNVYADNTILILENIRRAALKLLGKEQNIPGGICTTDVIQSADYIQWGEFPSESLLTDVSTEFLVHSSDESTCGPSEVSLEDSS